MVYFWNIDEEVFNFLQEVDEFPSIYLNSEKTNLSDYDLFMVLVHPNDPKKTSILNTLDLKDVEYERVASGNKSLAIERYFSFENKKIRIFLLNGPSLKEETTKCQASILYDIFTTANFQHLSGTSLNSKLKCKSD